jgi:hypothetical protein
VPVPPSSNMSGDTNTAAASRFRVKHSTSSPGLDDINSSVEHQVDVPASVSLADGLGSSDGAFYSASVCVRDSTSSAPLSLAEDSQTLDEAEDDTSSSSETNGASIIRKIAKLEIHCGGSA